MLFKFYKFTIKNLFKVFEICAENNNPSQMLKLIFVFSYKNFIVFSKFYFLQTSSSLSKFIPY